MDIVNTVLGALFSLLLYPFRDMNPWIGLAVISLFTSVLVMLIFKLVSRPALIRCKKNRLLARVLELVIFKDDIIVNMGAFVRVLKANAAYLFVLTVPLIVCMIIFIPLTYHAYLWFGLRPLQEGETVVLKIRFDRPTMQDELNLESANGVTIDHEATVRVPGRNEVNWRIRIDEAIEEPSIVLTINDNRYETVVETGSTLRPLFEESRIGFGKEAGTQFIDYPERELLIAGRPVNWLLAFFIFTIVFGYPLMKPFKVEI